MKIEIPIFVGLLAISLLNLTYQVFVGCNNNDEKIAQKIMIIEAAKNSENPTVIASAKTAQLELQKIQQNKFEGEVRQSEQAPIRNCQSPEETKSSKFIETAVGVVVIMVLILGTFLCYGYYRAG